MAASGRSRVGVCDVTCIRSIGLCCGKNNGASYRARVPRGIVVNSWLLGGNVPGSNPDSSEDPPAQVNTLIPRQLFPFSPFNPGSF
ncbi:hypothetical protein AVEN_79570-1 [Araneus ventricosus]|uniref:Uncharacterized protein n=1 Tax=Araneus ventricosus TaxID=182803 RepID=A0A4Y2TVT1_ARAVE|nr:hypothetical protein AVEN_79570-1 [Araneus ventricosus]